MFKFEDIIDNKEYRERVIKYFRLPMRLSVSKEKFLSDLEFIKLINKEKYDNMIKLVEHDFNYEAKRQNTDEPDFTMEYILDPIVENFAQTPEWIEFEKKDYSDVLDDFEGVTNIHQFYKKENDGKCFLSIDLVSANWQSLQHIIGFTETYEDLIVKHTDNLIPPISKTVRTKITGLLNAKKIMDYNKKLLLDNKDIILKTIVDNLSIEFNTNEPFAFYADEIIMEISDELLKELYKVDYDNIEKVIYEAAGVKVHFVPFKLKWLNLDKSCIKIYKNKEYEVLNLSKDVLLMLNKRLNNIELNDIDFEKIKETSKSVANLENAMTIINNL